jgi:hypothetical protein
LGRYFGFADGSFRTNFLLPTHDPKGILLELAVEDRVATKTRVLREAVSMRLEVAIMHGFPQRLNAPDATLPLQCLICHEFLNARSRSSPGYIYPEQLTEFIHLSQIINRSVRTDLESSNPYAF